MHIDPSFKRIPFPSESSIFYLIVLEKNSSVFPIYVGESNRNVGRLGDYVSANFKASTDFKVGRAVRYLMECGHSPVVYYKGSVDRKREQNELLSELTQNGFRLLNHLSGYDYRSADEEKELEKIKKFTDLLIRDFQKFNP